MPRDFNRRLCNGFFGGDRTASGKWARFEANAIYMELGGIKPFRPQTHELLKRIITQLKGALRHIVITHEHENAYYAKLILEREGAIIEMDARPSDSIIMILFS